MQYLAFRNLIGVTHTEEEAKTIAEEVSLVVAIIVWQGLFDICDYGSLK